MNAAIAAILLVLANFDTVEQSWRATWNLDMMDMEISFPRLFLIATGTFYSEVARSTCLIKILQIVLSQQQVWSTTSN
jgi:hypothetical protein